MGILGRLFGRKDATQTPEADARTTAATAVADETAPPPRPTSLQATPPEQVTEATPPPAPPLRALEGFRHDPAFRNFMDKARRPPGAVARPRSRPGREEPPFGPR